MLSIIKSKNLKSTKKIQKEMFFIFILTENDARKICTKTLVDFEIMNAQWYKNHPVYNYCVKHRTST